MKRFLCILIFIIMTALVACSKDSMRNNDLSQSIIENNSIAENPSESQVENEISNSQKSAAESQAFQSSQSSVTSTSESSESSVSEPELLEPHKASDSSNVLLKLDKTTLSLSEINETFLLAATISNNSPNPIFVSAQYNFEYWSGDTWNAMSYDPENQPNWQTAPNVINPESSMDIGFIHWLFDKPLQSGQYRVILSASEIDKDGFPLVAEFEIKE